MTSLPMAGNGFGFLSLDILSDYCNREATKPKHWQDTVLYT
jgi:hypothetical protein